MKKTDYRDPRDVPPDVAGLSPRRMSPRTTQIVSFPSKPQNCKATNKSWQQACMQSLEIGIWRVSDAADFDGGRKHGQ